MSNAPFWNQRYQAPEFAYGKAPNVYFYEEIRKLTPGKLLLPCEGEGRNAVAAAQLGWDVSAFDISTEGQKKAYNLADEKQVQIDYKIGEIHQLDFQEKSFDAVGLIYAHMPPGIRELFHHHVASLLKPGGWLIMEAFHVKQLGNSSGGPQQIDMLYTDEILRNDFSELKIHFLSDLEIELNEGPYHQGKAHVIRLLAQK